MSELNKNIKVTVCGIGNSGVKIVDRLHAMKEASWLNICAIDTDENSLERASVPIKLLAANEWRQGRGCGGDIISGQRAISRERSKINDMIKDSSLLILVGGFGGGTATGGAPIIASVAKSAKVPMIYMVTMPFALEGHTRRRIAEDGMRELLPVVDVMLCLPNDLLFSSLPTDTPVQAAFEQADIQVARAVAGVTELLRCDNLLASDISDFRAVLYEKKSSCGIGVGIATNDDGLNRYYLAIERMLSSPFLGGVTNLNNSDALFLTVTGGDDLQLGEMKKAMEAIERLTGKKTKIMAGVNTDSAYNGMVQITAISIIFDKTSVVSGPASDASPRDAFYAKAFKSKDGVERKPVAGSSDMELKQGELPLQSVSKGIFINTTPTVYEGKDLDIPTFQREMIIIDKGS